MILAQQIERVEIQTHGQPARLNRFSVNDIFVVASKDKIPVSVCCQRQPIAREMIRSSCNVLNTFETLHAHGIHFEMTNLVVPGYVHDPDIELAEVAFLLGFSDQSAISRAFKRWTGCPPSEARKSKAWEVNDV